MKTYTLSNLIQRVAIILAIVAAVGSANLVSAQPGEPVPKTAIKMDFTGDGSVDLVFRTPGTSKWIIQSMDGTDQSRSIGQSDSISAAADYDGDGIEDLAAVTRKGDQLVWQIQRSSDRAGAEVTIQWGLDADVPVTGDYDGDGMADPAVWRPSEAVWYILASSSGEMTVINWGIPTDKPMAGDFDGDGRSDVCVFRPSNSTFYYLGSSDDQMHEQVYGPFSYSGFEVFVPADYDGDGKTDFATYHPTTGGMWMVLGSVTKTLQVASIEGSTLPCSPHSPERCLVTDFAIHADYDRDGKIDPAIWDSKTAKVTVLGSKDGVIQILTQTTEDMFVVSSFYTTK